MWEVDVVGLIPIGDDMFETTGWPLAAASAAAVAVGSVDEEEVEERSLPDGPQGMQIVSQRRRPVASASRDSKMRSSCRSVASSSVNLSAPRNSDARTWSTLTRPWPPPQLPPLLSSSDAALGKNDVRKDRSTWPSFRNSQPPSAFG